MDWGRAQVCEAHTQRACGQQAHVAYQLLPLRAPACILQLRIADLWGVQALGVSGRKEKQKGGTQEPRPG